MLVCHRHGQNIFGVIPEFTLIKCPVIEDKSGGNLNYFLNYIFLLLRRLIG